MGDCRHCVGVVLLVLLSAGAARGQDDTPVESDVRTWKSRDNRYSTEASFVAFKAGRVQLRKRDGKTNWVPLRQLGDRDQAYVRQVAGDDPEAVASLNKLRARLQLDEAGRTRGVYFRKGARIGETEMRLLKGLPNLEHLQLAQCRFQEETLQELRDIPSLRRLDLSHTPMDTSGVRQLLPLTQLEALSLAGTHIKNSALAQVKQLTSLQELVLANTDVGDNGIAHLETMPELKRINLDNTKVSPQGLVRLTQSLDAPQIQASGVIRSRR